MDSNSNTSLVTHFSNQCITAITCFMTIFWLNATPRSRKLKVSMTYNQWFIIRSHLIVETFVSCPVKITTPTIYSVFLRLHPWKGRKFHHVNTSLVTQGVQTSASVNDNKQYKMFRTNLIKKVNFTSPINCNSYDYLMNDLRAQNKQWRAKKITYSQQKLIWTDRKGLILNYKISGEGIQWIVWLFTPNFTCK